MDDSKRNLVLMTCKHHNGAGCSLGLFGGIPSAGVCKVCNRYDGPTRGAGDIVHRVAEKTGISTVVKFVSNATGKDCGCAKRRAALNEALPFSDKTQQE